MTGRRYHTPGKTQTRPHSRDLDSRLWGAHQPVYPSLAPTKWTRLERSPQLRVAQTLGPTENPQAGDPLLRDPQLDYAAADAPFRPTRPHLDPWSRSPNA